MKKKKQIDQRIEQIELIPPLLTHHDDPISISPNENGYPNGQNISNGTSNIRAYNAMMRFNYCNKDVADKTI